MDKRIEPRIKKRMACTVIVGGRRHSGIVLDISARGMFIQTHAKPNPGDEVEVDLSVPTQREKVLLHATVTRKRIVPAQLLSVAQGGIGVRIRSAPEAYYELLAAITPGSATPSGSPSKVTAVPLGSPSRASAAPSGSPSGTPATPGKVDPAPVSEPADANLTQFRVRVSEVGGSRSRRFFVNCASEEEARKQVLVELGETWKILEVERV